MVFYAIQRSNTVKPKLEVREVFVGGCCDGVTALIHYDCKAGVLELSMYDGEGKLVKRIKTELINMLVGGRAEVRSITYAHGVGFLTIVRGELSGACEGAGGE